MQNPVTHQDTAINSAVSNAQKLSGPSNYPTGAVATAQAPFKVGREWFIEGATWGCFPKTMQFWGEANPDRLYGFPTKRSALTNWHLLHGTPTPFQADQHVWYYAKTRTASGRTVPLRVAAKVLNCTHSHAIILFSHNGYAVMRKVLLSALTAREEVA